MSTTTLDYNLLKTKYPSPAALQKAPIQEAILAFYFRDGNFDALLEKLKDSFSEYIWERHMIKHIKVQFDFPNNELTPTIEENVDNDAFRFVGRPKTTLVRPSVIIVVENGQISVSMLRPYAGWDVFTDLAQPVWQIFQGITSANLRYYGIRYINKFEFGLPLSAYLPKRLVPTSTDLVLNQTSFQSFMNQRIEGTPYTATIQLNFEPTETLNGSTNGHFLMDIAIKPDLDGASLSSPERLEELRILKNHLFFNTIDPQAIKLCQ